MQQEVSYRRSSGGTDKEEECRAKYNELLLLWAVARMKKRRSSTLDESDYENAHRDLLADSIIDWPSQLIGYVLILAAGGLISWGVSYFPKSSGGLDVITGIALVLVGLGLGAVGVFVQLRRK